jgi:hypothetical protein
MRGMSWIFCLFLVYKEQADWGPSWNETLITSMAKNIDKNVFAYSVKFLKIGSRRTSGVISSNDIFFILYLRFRNCLFSLFRVVCFLTVEDNELTMEGLSM